jgi:hypothetical protein
MARFQLTFEISIFFQYFQYFKRKDRFSSRPLTDRFPSFASSTGFTPLASEIVNPFSYFQIVIG